MFSHPDYATSANATPRSGSRSSQIYQNDVARLLAEIHFINAEVCKRVRPSPHTHVFSCLVSYGENDSSYSLTLGRVLQFLNLRELLAFHKDFEERNLFRK